MKLHKYAAYFIAFFKKMCRIIKDFWPQQSQKTPHFSGGTDLYTMHAKRLGFRSGSLWGTEALSEQRDRSGVNGVIHVGRFSVADQ